MATIPLTRSWIAGEVETGAIGNAQWRDPINFLLGGAAGRKPSFRVHQATGQTVATGVESKITYDTVDEDTDGGWSGASFNYTVQTPGMWVLSAAIAWASNATGQRMIHLLGSNYSDPMSWTAAASDSSGRVCLSLVTRLIAGNGLQVNAFQNTGGNLALAPATSPIAFSGVWLGA